MRGLRKQEDDRFMRFAKVVETAAAEKGSVFFFDAALGDDFPFKDMDCDNCVGWLIPDNKATDFENFFKKDNINSDQWDDFYVVVEPVISNGKLLVTFS